jgi:hypothetical protein
MTDPDIVAELDAWLADNQMDCLYDMFQMIQRARDEIVALRAKYFFAVRAAAGVDTEQGVDLAIERKQ